jgi:hypothetical protein
MQVFIQIQTRVSIAPSQIGGGNKLQMCRKMLEVDENTTSIIVRNFCTSIRLHLKPLLFGKSNCQSIKK